MGFPQLRDNRGKSLILSARAINNRKTRFSRRIGNLALCPRFNYLSARDNPYIFSRCNNLIAFTYSLWSWRAFYRPFRKAIRNHGTDVKSPHQSIDDPSNPPNLNLILPAGLYLHDYLTFSTALYLYIFIFLNCSD